MTTPAQPFADRLATPAASTNATRHPQRSSLYGQGKDQRRPHDPTHDAINKKKKGIQHKGERHPLSSPPLVRETFRHALLHATNEVGRQISGQLTNERTFRGRADVFGIDPLKPSASAHKWRQPCIVPSG